jgi:hypothetical protein
MRAIINKSLKKRALLPAGLGVRAECGELRQGPFSIGQPSIKRMFVGWRKIARNARGG